MKSETVAVALNRARAEVYKNREVRQPDKVECFNYGWVVVLGLDAIENDLIYLGNLRLTKNDIETHYPAHARMFDTCADAMAACAEIMRDSLSDLDCGCDFPAPEYPRVAHVKFSASVWFGSNS